MIFGLHFVQKECLVGNVCQLGRGGGALDERRMYGMAGEVWFNNPETTHQWIQLQE